MTVGELIRELQKIPRDRPIYIASDPEGNSIRHIHQLSREKWSLPPDEFIVIFPAGEVGRL